MANKLSRRAVIKILAGSGVALYLDPTLRSFGAAPAWATAGGIADISPIDRSLGDAAPPIFFGDDPERTHKILQDKKGFVSGLAAGIPAPKEHAPVVVVGGGIAGLFSAYLLKEHKPVILEQASRFGGNAKGQAWRGIDYSIGAAYFIEPEEGSDIAKLVEELGLNDVLRIKEDEDPVAVNGTIHKAFWSGETLGGDAKAKKQLEKLSVYFKKVNEGEEIAYPDIPITDPKQKNYIHELDKVSFKTHLKKIVGGELAPQIETVIEQYCWSSMGAAADEVSAASGLNFYASEFGNVAVPAGGNSAVAERVLGRLCHALPKDNFRAGALVFDVRVVDDGVVVAYQDSAGTVRSIHAETVVMACPKFVVEKVLEGIEPERLQAIKKLKYRSYLIANVCLKGGYPKPFYDLYLLGDGKINSADVEASARKQGVTDVILASYARPNADNTVLTLYRGMPFDGARPEIDASGSYQRYREEFQKQLTENILPLLNLKKEDIVDLRVARWGHPLPVAAPGLIANGTVETIRKPFKERVFFVEQDNWALPAFETSVTEALIWAPELMKRFI